MPKPKKVCVCGSGNWATTVAILVGDNVRKHPHLHETVTMYVYEELIKGRLLTEIINTDHENVKYLPGFKIPSNVVAIPDVVLAAKDADAIIFVIPHRRIRDVCTVLEGKIKPTACALSLVKGFQRADDGGMELVSSIIRRCLRISVSVLMGATQASEVASGQFAEAALGCQNKQIGPLWSDIVSTENFKVIITEDITSVEVYSGVKSIIAFGAGLLDGLDAGDNGKAALLRLGVMEMIKFVDVFYPGAHLSTFFESCGIADLISECYGGRNQRFGDLFVRTGKSVKELEEEYLNGQELQGPVTASEAYCMVKDRSMDFRFPIMVAIHLICIGEMRPDQLISAMKSYPETTLVLHNTAFLE